MQASANNGLDIKLLKKNLSALAKVNPVLAQKVAQTFVADAEVIETRSGVPSVRLLNAGGKQVTMHSTVDPVREAKRLVDTQLKDGANACLVYGMALGYHLDYLMTLLPERSRVLVVEPHLTIFRLALSVRDFSEHFTNTSIRWAVGEPVTNVPAYLGEILSVTSIEKLSIIEHGVSARLCGNYFAHLDDLARKWVVAVGGNFLTNVQSVKKYISNSLANIESIVNDPPIGKLFGSFKKVPAVVISAGPSLDRNIDLLRILEKHAVLICVDTVLGPLKRAGIKPHFVLAGDPGELNYKHVEGLSETGAALVAEPMTHPRIISEFKGRRFVMSFNENLMKKLKNQLGDFGVVRAWGSISTGAFDLAKNLGCDPIAFVGQDLSFPNLRYYTHGTYQEVRWLRDLEYPDTTDKHHKVRMINENNLDSVDIFGRPMRTSKVLEAYRQYFERVIESTGARVINCTEGGTGFQGVENMPLEQFLWRFARKERSVRRMVESVTSTRSSSETEAVFEYLDNTSYELSEMCKLCNEGFNLAQEIHKQESSDPEKDFHKLEKIYSRVYELKSILELIEHANQGGLLVFQRGIEKLKGEEDPDIIHAEGAKLYGSFFITFYQTAFYLRKSFEKSAATVGATLHHDGLGDENPDEEEIDLAG